MKLFALVLGVFAQSLLVNAAVAQADSGVTCITRDMLVPGGTNYMAAMREASKAVYSQHRDLLDSVGVGWCLELPKTSVVAVAKGQIQPELQPECLGMTFLVYRAVDMKDRALKILGTQSSLIDGRAGAVIVTVSDQNIKMPICMENFEGGGPQ